MATIKRKRYNKGKRVDMRQGGRVRLQRGGGKAKGAGSALGQSMREETRKRVQAKRAAEQKAKQTQAPIPTPTAGKGPAGKGPAGKGKSFDPNIGQPPKKQPTTQPPILGDPFTDPNHPLYGTIDPAPDYPDFPQPTVSPQPTVPQPTVSPQPTFPITPTDVSIPDLPTVGDPYDQKPWQQPRSPYVQEDGRGDDRGP